MLRNRLTVASLAVLALVLAACGGDGAEAADTTVPPGSSATTLDVSMTDFAFDPDSLTVAAGEDITLNLENIGGIEHNFVIMSTPIDAEAEYDPANAVFEVNLPPDAADTVTFTAPEAGTYQVICSISGHFTAGMVAELVSS